MRPRQRVTSMRSPANPSRAGSRVTLASMVMITVVDAATAMPFTNGSPIKSSPSSENMTVVPAKMTARPAVSIASTVAASGSSPRCRLSR